jgi:hypothetical protein
MLSFLLVSSDIVGRPCPLLFARSAICALHFSLPKGRAAVTACPESGSRYGVVVEHHSRPLIQNRARARVWELLARQIIFQKAHERTIAMKPVVQVACVGLIVVLHMSSAEILGGWRDAYRRQVPIDVAYGRLHRALWSDGPVGTLRSSSSSSSSAASGFLGFGFHIQIGNLLQHVADAVELRHALRNVAQLSERCGEFAEQGQVLYAARGICDDVAKGDCEGREGCVEECPVAVRRLDVFGKTGVGSREFDGEPERVPGCV